MKWLPGYRPGYLAPASYAATWFRVGMSATVKEEVMMSPYIAAFLFLQTDDAAAPIAHTPTSGVSAVFDMVRNSGPVAIGVLVLLLIASLYSWAVILGKSATFRRARTQSRRFMRAFRKADRLQEIAAVSEQFKPSPLVTVFDEVYDTYRRQT